MLQGLGPTDPPSTCNSFPLSFLYIFDKDLFFFILGETEMARVGEGQRKREGEPKAEYAMRAEPDMGLDPRTQRS